MLACFFLVVFLSMVPFLSLCGRVVKYEAKVGKFMGLKINIIYLVQCTDQNSWQAIK